MHFRALIVVLAFGSGAVQAQLKPPADMGGTPSQPQSAPTAPATPPAPAVDPATAAKEAAAAKVAADWLKLIDGAEYGKAWDECAPLFRDKVPRQQWIDGIPKNRAEYGALRSRKFNAAAHRNSLPGAPDGEYVTVRFISEYEKNPSADELVTLTYHAGAWRPIGYLLR